MIISGDDYDGDDADSEDEDDDYVFASKIAGMSRLISQHLCSHNV